MFICHTGNSKLEASKWMLSLEGEVVMHGDEFVVGISTLFASYYVLNVQYESAGAATLEFIQRFQDVFFKICVMNLYWCTGLHVYWCTGLRKV